MALSRELKQAIYAEMYRRGQAERLTLGEALMPPSDRETQQAWAGLLEEVARESPRAQDRYAEGVLDVPRGQLYLHGYWRRED